jgi:hypothetical protein
MQEPVNPALSRRPPAHIVIGMLLIGVSYLIGWPAIALLGTIAAWARRPELLLGSPFIYGFSWLVFTLGLVVLGPKALYLGRAFGMAMIRRLAEKYLSPRG